MKKIVHQLRNRLRDEGSEIRTGRWQGTNGPPVMVELLHISEKIQMEQTVEDASISTNAKQPWADLHFSERVQGFPTNPDPSHSIWARTTKDYMSDGEKFSHTYSERLWSKGLHTGIRFEIADLNTLVQLLKKEPDTRQAYLPMFFPEDLTASLKGERVPCSLGWQFIVRNNRLDVFYPMRSCDAMRHLHNDLYLANRLAIWVRDKANLKVDLGILHFVATSLHCFKQDIDIYNRGLIR